MDNILSSSHTLHMNRLLEKLDQLLFPEKYRRYVTFRVATVFVAAVAIGSSILDLMNGRTALLHDASGQAHGYPKVVHSPGFIALHVLVLALGFWLLYRTREKKEYYRFRVLLYGMLLGGMAAEILNYLLPPRF